MSLPSPRILLIGGYLGNKRWTSSILTLDLASLLPSLTALRPALATTATATTSAPPRAPPPPLPPPPLGATLSAISAKAKAGAGGGLHTAGPARRKRSHASDSEAEGDPQSAAVGAGRHEAEVAGGKATPGGKAAAGAKPTKPGAAVGAQGGKRARAQGRAVAAAAAAEEAEEAAAEEEEEEAPWEGGARTARGARAAPLRTPDGARSGQGGGAARATATAAAATHGEEGEGEGLDQAVEEGSARRELRMQRELGQARRHAAVAL